MRSAVSPSQRGAGRAPQGEWAHDLYKDKEPVMEPVARAQQQQQGPPPAQGSSYTGGGGGGGGRALHSGRQAGVLHFICMEGSWCSSL